MRSDLSKIYFLELHLASHLAEIFFRELYVHSLSSESIRCLFEHFFSTEKKWAHAATLPTQEWNPSG